MDILERVRQSAMKMIKVLEHPSYEERLRGLELFSLEKSQSDLSAVYKYLMGGVKNTEPDSSQWY